MRVLILANSIYPGIVDIYVKQVPQGHIHNMPHNIQATNEDALIEDLIQTLQKKGQFQFHMQDRKANEPSYEPGCVSRNVMSVGGLSRLHEVQGLLLCTPNLGKLCTPELDGLAPAYLVDRCFGDRLLTWILLMLIIVLVEVVVFGVRCICRLALGETKLMNVGVCYIVSGCGLARCPRTYEPMTMNLLCLK